MICLTRQQVRDLDHRATSDLGIPGIVLMENAARSVSNAALDYLEQEMQLVAADANVAIVCGGGNNGGDGFAVARHLHNAGVHVTLYAAKDPAELTGDAATNAQVALNMGLEVIPVLDEAAAAQQAPEWAQANLVIDALLGTGFTGEVRGHLATIIGYCNAARDWGAKVLAIDVPSGLDCDTGLTSGPAVRADLTVTLVAVKIGFTAPEAREYLGQVILGDIGTPPELIQQVLGLGQA